MVFRLFKKKTKPDSIAGNVSEAVLCHQAYNLLEKAKSLKKLKRYDESQELFKKIEQSIKKHLKSNPTSITANKLLAHVYWETGDLYQAESVLDKLLTSKKIELPKEDEMFLNKLLEMVRKQQPLKEKLLKGNNDSYAQIYSCQNCGRLIKFISIPCTHCQWLPNDLNELGRSFVLSNKGFHVSALLLLSREVSKGRKPSEIVPSLGETARKLLAWDEAKDLQKRIFTKLKEEEGKSLRSIKAVRQCPNCLEQILYCNQEKCGNCGEIVQWPEILRLLICMDNILWLFEQRFESSTSPEVSEFVCLLVTMIDELVRKQEAPSNYQRQYALQLLEAIESIYDKNRGAVIKTEYIEEIEMFIFEQNILQDSEYFGMFACSELTYFVKRMKESVEL